MINLVTRRDWGARQPKYVNRGSLNDISTCHWNGPTITVYGKTIWDHSRCPVLVRGIQDFHMDGRGWSDIAYNFVECPHGFTFEGRGLNVINGANGTNEGNRTSHAVMCLAGENNPFPDVEKMGFRECVMYIANNTAAPEGCKGHRDHKSTACPGDARYEWVHQGMPIVDSVVPRPITLIEEEDIMNEPFEIVKGSAKSPWFATDGITKQWVQNREHAAILCLNRGAKAHVKPTSMAAEELSKMAPNVWPQSAVDSIRLVGQTPPA